MLSNQGANHPTFGAILNKTQSVVLKPGALEIEKQILEHQLPSHPNLIKFITVFQNRTLCTSMIGKGLTLRDVSDSIRADHKQFSSRWLCSTIKDMTAVIRFIHAHNVCHNDIDNGGNWICDHNGKIVLIDFGNSDITQSYIWRRSDMVGLLCVVEQYILDVLPRWRMQSDPDLISLVHDLQHLAHEYDYPRWHL